MIVLDDEIIRGSYLLPGPNLFVVDSDKSLDRCSYALCSEGRKGLGKFAVFERCDGRL
jgi:hypothetical protein